MNIYITPYNLLNYAGIHDDEIKVRRRRSRICAGFGATMTTMSAPTSHFTR